MIGPTVEFLSVIKLSRIPPIKLTNFDGSGIITAVCTADFSRREDQAFTLTSAAKAKARVDDVGCWVRFVGNQALPDSSNQVS